MLGILIQTDAYLRNQDSLHMKSPLTGALVTQVLLSVLWAGIKDRTSSKSGDLLQLKWPLLYIQIYHVIFYDNALYILMG